MSSSIMTSNSSRAVPMKVTVLFRHAELKEPGSSSIGDKEKSIVSDGDFQQCEMEIASAPPGLESSINLLFTQDCLEFLSKLHHTFNGRINMILQERISRRLEYVTDDRKVPEFSKAPEHPSSWTVDPIPKRLSNRKLDVGSISPAQSELLVAALKTNAQGIQVDFDDGHCPSWRNQLSGWRNVYLTVRNQLDGAPTLVEAPVLMLRPRAWNMKERNITINGREVAGALLDFGVLMYHNGRMMSDQESGPFFYLSKVESALEARLWDDMFTWTESQLGLPFGAIKSCVLIENVLASFQMEEILYELRHHSIGLNAGIWDYSASIISLFGRRPEFIIPDRIRFVNLDQVFLRSYYELLVRVCHRHGALATGGMASLILEGDDAKKEIIQRVCDAKLKEIRLELDGFLVHDLGLVPHLNKLWSEHFPAAAADNQLCPGGIGSLKKEPLLTSGADLLSVPKGHACLAALRRSISVTILFIQAWLQEKGTFIYDGAVEDSATAEISRWQLWQWIFHGVLLEDGVTVSRQLVFELADRDEQVLDTRSVEIFKELMSLDEPPVFITTYLSHHPTFISATS